MSRSSGADGLLMRGTITQSTDNENEMSCCCEVFTLVELQIGPSVFPGPDEF